MIIQEPSNSEILSILIIKLRIILSIKDFAINLDLIQCIRKSIKGHVFYL